MFFKYNVLHLFNVVDIYIVLSPIL